MKKIIPVLVLTFLLHIPAQAQWKIIDSITGANYINVHFWDANTGIISGQSQGRFFKTYNGGISWDTITAPILINNDYLTDMQFVNDKIGFVCGGSGFAPAQSMLIGTKDGGLTWDSLAFNIPGGIELKGLNFKDIDGTIKGIVFNYYSMFKTFDSGKTLSQVSMPSTTLFVINTAVLLNNTIILSGYVYPNSHSSSIYTSTDWGITWHNVFTDTIAAISLCVKGNMVIAGEGHGYIARSLDGGTTWTKSKVGTSDDYFTKIKAGKNNDVYMIGYTSVFGSDDNGVTWHRTQVDTPFNSLWDISMPSRDTGYIISNRRLYKTTTGGGLALNITNIAPVEDNIKIYPNPANTALHITVPTGVTVKAVTIYDASGRFIKQLRSDWQQIDVTVFAKGAYMIEINTGNSISRKKLVIQ